MNSNITRFVKGLSFSTISDERKTTLQPLINYVQEGLKANSGIELNFICTHNSRRSHLCQVWATIAAHHYKIAKVYCYSGGTEATAVYPQIIDTLDSIGCEITQLTDGSNPMYKLDYATNTPAISLWSKVYNAPENPREDFAAILTCSDADENCPVIPNSTRLSITYEDPKAFDNTSQKEKMYTTRSTQIATEMMYVFSKIVQNESV